MGVIRVCASHSQGVTSCVDAPSRPCRPRRRQRIVLVVIVLVFLTMPPVPWPGDVRYGLETALTGSAAVVTGLILRDTAADAIRAVSRKLGAWVPRVIVVDRRPGRRSVRLGWA